MTSYTNFGTNDPPLKDLPADFRAAIESSISCEVKQYQSSDGKGGCNVPAYYASGFDDIIGSARYGYGYCANPLYRQTTYCACVNAPIDNPMCFFKPCNGSENAFKPSTTQAKISNLNKNCPQENVVNCTQVFEMGGSDNVASRVTQIQNCGVVNNFVTNIQTHPVLAIVVLILLLSVIMLVSGPRHSANRGVLLPPPDMVLPPLT